jgi:hypothetical protein
MSLLAYNLTTAPLLLAAGAPVVTLPASASAGSRGPALNVTGELKGQLAPAFALLQQQVALGYVQYEWTGLPEFQVYSLVVGSAQTDLSNLPVQLWVDAVTGDDANPGTLTAPFKSFDYAWNKLPAELKANDNRLFVKGSLDLNQARYVVPKVAGSGTPLIVMADAVDQIGPQIAAGASVGPDYVCTVDPLIGDDSLRGAYLRNTSTNVRILVSTNVTVLGVCTISVIANNGVADVTPGDTFAVERAGAELRSPQFGVPTFAAPGLPPAMGFLNVKLAEQADPGFGLPLVNFDGSFVFEAIEFDGGPSGRGVFGSSGARWRFSDPDAWSGDTSVPFNTDNQFAGFYCHAGAPMVVTMSDRSAFSLAILVDIAVLDFELLTGVFVQSIDARVITMYISNYVTGFMRRGKIAGDLFGDIAAIVMNDGVTFAMGFTGSPAVVLDISGAAGAGVYATGMCNVSTGRLTGTNGDVGIGVDAISLLRVSPNTLIHGPLVGDDVRVVSTVKTYAALPYTEDGSRAQPG